MPALDKAFVFPWFAYLEIISESLELATNLLAQIQLLETQTLIVPFPIRPSKAIMQPYLTTIGRTCTPKALTDIRLLNRRSFSNGSLLRPHAPDPDTRLTFHDLASCATFVNLRGIHINLEWPIDLSDGDLPTLVEAWPHIEHILINDQWGYTRCRHV